MQDISPRPGATLILRVLIVSYFVALSLGLISGTEIARLATPFLPETAARPVMGALVLVLAGMVLVGRQRRAAALVLALVVFWSSYLTLFAGGLIGSFWRDLALIGGLLLTAGIGADGGRPDDGEHGGDEGPRYRDEPFDYPAEFRVDGFRGTWRREKAGAVRAG